MRVLLKLLAWLVGLALMIGLYFSDNIRGYYRFKEICAKEAGLKVFRPLERNIGWTVKGGRIEDTGMAVYFKDVAFVRYRNEKDGNLYDVYRAPKLKVGDPGYAQQPADLNKTVVYQFSVETIHSLPNEIRTGVQHFDVTEMKTSRLAVRYSRLGYSKFDPDKTILGAPSGERCPDDWARTDPKTGMALPSKLNLAFASSFAN